MTAANALRVVIENAGGRVESMVVSQFENDRDADRRKNIQFDVVGKVLRGRCKVVKEMSGHLLLNGVVLR